MTAILRGVTSPSPRGRRRATPNPATVSAELAPPGGTELDMAILRFLRRSPNRFVDLSPLAEEIGIDPFILQLTVERLHRRGLLQAPFIEPGTAGGAELTEKGLRWLLAQEGGKPSEVPVALKPATERVRAEAEAARLPRAQVYGVGR